MANPTIIHGVGLKEILREKVQDALLRQHVSASEFVEFYLVNLLADFHDAERPLRDDGTDLLTMPLAILLLEADDGDLATRIRRFRKLGDIALVISSFYTDRLRRALVGLSYYIAMGGSAYARLVTLSEGQQMFAELYRELSSKFAALAGALSIVAPWNRACCNADLVRIYERWLATGDERLEALLTEGGISTEGKATGTA